MIWWHWIVAIVIWVLVIVGPVAFTAFGGRKRDQGDADAEQAQQNREVRP